MIILIVPGRRGGDKESMSANPLASVASGHIVKSSIFARDGLKAVRLSIAPGGIVPTHSSNADVVAVVVHGRGRFIVDGQPVALAPGAVVDMRADTPHSIEADESLELVVLHCRLGSGDTPVSCGA
ncbi:MAG: cupin domain-containing protein [Terriglobales bacterium]